MLLSLFHFDYTALLRLLHQIDETMSLQHSASAAQVAGWLTFHRFANYIHVFQQYTGTCRTDG